MRLTRLVILAILLCLQLAPGWAMRTFPQDIRTGILQVFDFPYIQISSQVYRLSPGAKIRNQGNMILQPVNLRGTGNVAFRVDQGGQLSGLWILSVEEIEDLKAHGYKFDTKQ